MNHSNATDFVDRLEYLQSQVVGMTIDYCRLGRLVVIEDTTHYDELFRLLSGYEYFHHNENAGEISLLFIRE